MNTILIVLILLSIIATIIFYKGKGGFLIAGYNTAPKEIKKLYDVKKLNKAYFYFFCLITLYLFLYLVLGKSFEKMFVVLCLLSTFYLLFYEFKKCKL